MGRLPAFGPSILAVLAGLYSSPAALAADQLEMYIDNSSSEIMYFASESRVDAYPVTISPGATGFVKANAPRDLMQGAITYMNNSVSTQATCTATLSFQYESGFGGQCDKKSFTPTTTGNCTLVRDGDCYGNNSCKCNFTFSIP